MRRIIFGLVACFLLLPLAVNAADKKNALPAGKAKVKASTKAEQSNKQLELKAAEVAALYWLKLIDQGKYGESYDAAAAYFQGAVDKKQWEKLIASVMQPLGKRIKRKVIKKTYAKTLPGAPDGEYVVIQLQSSYANKKKAVETITPMKEGIVWKVSGYYIN